MKEKTVNFIYALVVGRVSVGDSNLKNVWNNEMAVNFFINHFIPTFPPKEKVHGTRTSYFHLFKDKNCNNTEIVWKRKKGNNQCRH